MTGANSPPDRLAVLEDWLVTHQHDLVELALDLVGIDSQNPPGKTQEIVSTIESFATDLGVESERVVANESKPNVILSLPGDSEMTLLYNGHLDTVPYDRDDWQFDPLGERTDGRIYGRGATDMKGAVAAMLHALRAYANTGTRPPIGLTFAFVSDEETAGPAGLETLLERESLSADACLIGEPTCVDGAHSVTVADKGSIWLHLEATGQAAHGSRPQLGDNAIDALYAAIDEIRTFLSSVELEIDADIAPIIEESVAFYAPQLGEETARQLFTKPTTNLGTFEGGGTINQVPDTARAALDIRLTAGVQTPRILASIENHLGEHPCVTVDDISWSIGTYEPYESPLPVATSHVAETIAGESVYRRMATGGGDAKTLRNAGISTVEFAFGSDTAHAVDEFVPIDALQHNATVYTCLPFAFAKAFDDPVNGDDPRDWS